MVSFLLLRSEKCLSILSSFSFLFVFLDQHGHCQTQSGIRSPYNRQGWSFKAYTSWCWQWSRSFLSLIGIQRKDDSGMCELYKTLSVVLMLLFLRSSMQVSILPIMVSHLFHSLMKLILAVSTFYWWLSKSLRFTYNCYSYPFHSSFHVDHAASVPYLMEKVKHNDLYGWYSLTASFFPWTTWQC